MKETTRRIVAIVLPIGTGVVLALLIAFLSRFGWRQEVSALFQWLDRLGPLGVICFILIQALVVITLFPGIVFTMGAGFLFGVVLGTIVIVTGTTLGALVAFLLGRHVLRGRAATFLLRYPRLKTVNERLADRGGRVVLLTRLVPFFPFKLSNYFFGLAGYRLQDVVLGTFFGIVPITLFNVYLGSLAADAAAVGAGRGERTTAEWAVYLGGFVITVIVFVYIVRLAWQALDAAAGDGGAVSDGDDAAQDDDGKNA